jgi:small conductance mechanosensitive channel
MTDDARLLDNLVKVWWGWALGPGVRILIVLIGSIVLARLLRAVADRVARLGGDGGPLDERTKRARTLVGLLRAVGTSAVVVIAVIMVLRELGFDVTPIVAGAGVAGIAIGFGAQSLIKDIFGGLSILAEDQFRVGDVIRAVGIEGQVDRIGLRVTVVRDAQGVVHIIPNGEIKVVSNLTKGWARAVVDVGVPYREDLERVKKTLEAAARDLAADPEYGGLMLEPPAVLGVENLAETRVILRVAARTAPLVQDKVARELRGRIKLALEREGITIP